MRTVLASVLAIAASPLAQGAGGGCFDFESGPPSWRPQEGMAVALDTQTKHSGARSLRLSGRWQGREQWYATSNSFPLGSASPNTRYPFEGWMYVESVTPPFAAPSFWVRTAPRGYNGGKMLTTSNYDVTKLGAWQPP